VVDVDKKFRSNRQFSWPTDGHRLNLYLNCYLNVPVRVDKFKDYIAAGLEQLAVELRMEAAKDRGRWLRAQVESEAIVQPLIPEEEREIAKETKEIDKQIARDEREMARDVR
jgi:hypothetical protein